MKNVQFREAGLFAAKFKIKKFFNEVVQKEPVKWRKISKKQWFLGFEVIVQPRNVALLWHNAKVLALLKVKCEIYYCALEPCSMDSLGHQQRAKNRSPQIELHFKVLCESKAILPMLLPKGVNCPKNSIPKLCLLCQ